MLASQLPVVPYGSLVLSFVGPLSTALGNAPPLLETPIDD